MKNKQGYIEIKKSEEVGMFIVEMGNGYDASILTVNISDLICLRNEINKIWERVSKNDK